MTDQDNDEMATETLERPQVPAEGPRRRAWLPWVVAAFVVVLIAGTATAVIATRDSGSNATTDTQQLASLQQACAQWHTSYAGQSAPPADWCSSMIAWMGGHMSAGAASGTATWSNPDAMRASCRQWMSSAPIAGTGVDATRWCDQMVGWMTQYAGQGSWHDWMMRGPITR